MARTGAPFIARCEQNVKEQALARTPPLHGRPGRFRAGDQLLGFLNSL
jgi:hypothetical protein